MQVPFNGLMSSEMKAHAMLLICFKLGQSRQSARGCSNGSGASEKTNHAWGTGESTTGVIDALLQTEWPDLTPVKDMTPYQKETPIP
jgi:hypothetical protein